MNVKDTKPPPGAIELERFLPYRLNVVAEAVSRALSRIYAERYGITVPEWRILATLGQYGRMTAKDIGAHSRMHKTKVSRAVAHLAGNGLVERMSNADDLRESYLMLTGDGQKVYCSIVPQAIEFAEGLFDGIPACDREMLERLLHQLEMRANQMSKEGE